MLKKLFTRMFKPEGLENAQTPQDKQLAFVLTIDDKPIGELRLDQGVWHFTYSNWFVKQTTIAPLIDFPDKNRPYHSTELWPFFLARIPGIKQPAIQKVIKQEKIDPNDLPSLLKRFGKKAIQNPFELNFVS